MHAAPDPIHYVPIGTTALAAVFLAVLLRRAASRRFPPHLMWWAFGVFAYGLGTALEGSITLLGNSVPLNKAWYIAGALLGGWPLAQGSVYLLTPRRFANITSAVTIPFIVLASTAVVLSPVDLEAFNAVKPGGAILQWSWVRYLTPFINLYAVIFLIGGAAWSAYRYFIAGDQPHRAAGNTCIALGAMLPGVGGAFAKAGHVEVLYVGEFVGLILILIGYGLCVWRPRAAPSPALASAQPSG